jgi:N-glycosylase/DNA lyase
MTSRLNLPSFSLRDTLECGQFFRFTKVMETYIVQSSGRLFSISQKGDTLSYEGVDESFLVHFFRLEEPLEAILEEIDRDPVIHEAIRKYRGMRLIRQDPWECLISYLCSSAKAIPQIRSIIEALCKCSGKKREWDRHVVYDFPEPCHLTSASLLEPVGAGFRKQFLISAAEHMSREGLQSLRGLPYEEARRSLMGLYGVGKKVADCTLLYSLDFLEAFPIDTWIKKGLQQSYFRAKRVGDREMERFVKDHFGPLAGYAQLYLYHFWRHRPIRP